MPLTTVDQGLLSTNAQYTGFKNRIINGDMVIDQRNNGASLAIPNAASTYTLDRWEALETGSMAFSVQRSTTVPSGAGFVNSVLITTTTAAAPASGSRSQFAQYIEGFNVADLRWGTANAQPVTLSFWVRSSLTGQFGGAFQNATQDRSYPYSYTISAANTWEYKTVTIPGDTTGTWNTTNGRGVCVYFDLGMGSDLLGPAGAWVGADDRGATGDVRLSETNGATFFLTGVQLEKGQTATSFDVLPYSTELQLCRRYCPVFIGEGSAGAGVWGYWDSSNTFIGAVYFDVQARVSPTGITAIASQWNCNNSTVANPTANSISYNGGCVNSGGVSFTVASNGSSNGKAGRAYPNANPAIIIFNGCEL